jgi:hypothetical protein
MKYYILTYSIDHKVIGPDYPQAGPGKDYNRKGPHAYPNVHHNEFPDFIPDLDYFELHKKAPLTDFVSSGLSHGFIVSQRVKDLLQDYKIVPHRFYPMRMKRGNEFFDHYYWMHIVSDLSDYVDFQKTKFFVSDYLKKIGDIDISTKDEYLEVIKKFMDDTKEGFKNVEASKVAMLTKFMDLHLDLFVISYFDNERNISQSLKDRLIKEKVTGIEIKESKISFPVTSKT